jgi:hypothetical protein
VRGGRGTLKTGSDHTARLQHLIHHAIALYC